ncbi:MAG: DegT/DnrJ/EryC1/StrS family aminotransferase [Armatimonadetes bacterium]|nr:DegT/DnrJ/EryC1/StrS family aminotransferase [Armatimonadota bacterium]
MSDTLAIYGGTPVRREPWPATGRRFGETELEELRAALEQNTLFYTAGGKTRALCERMAALVGTEYAIACSSCSAAIHAALKACGVGPGDEVVTSPITDAGTVLGIVYEGAIPVFADVDPGSCNLTAETVAARLTERTRAVIAVHLQGNPVDLNPLLALCRRRGIRLIEDCAQAWGARLNDRPVGSMGDVGCYSLNDFKHISAGDGGLIVANDPELHHRAALAIDKCYDRIDGSRPMEFCAPNYRITELQSAVALAQLDRLPAIAERRHALGARLAAGLAGLDGVHAPTSVPGAWPSWWIYLIGLDAARYDAPAFAAAVVAEGVPVRVGYVEPVHLAYRYLRERSAFNHSHWPFDQATAVPDYAPGLCPNAERAMASCLLFPISEWLDEQAVDDAVAAVGKVAAGLG